MKETEIADEMIIGPEYEFHVFDGVSVSEKPNEIALRIYDKESVWTANMPAEENNGFHTPPHGGYHADQPSDVTFNLRNEMCMEMEKWGVHVKYHHHEVGGSGQLEIETELGEMTSLADATMAAKYVIRNTAAANGMTATFLPKPVYGEAGNGMHVHMLLKKDGKPVFYDPDRYGQLSETAMYFIGGFLPKPVYGEAGNGMHVHMLLKKDGKPVFYDPDRYGQLSETAMYFIGGLLTHVRSLCAITNPTTNSYKRLIPGFEAPVTIGYAMANRSAVVRIPAYVKSPDKKRFELRNPDATCNPYYAYAAIQSLLCVCSNSYGRIGRCEK